MVAAPTNILEGQTNQSTTTELSHTHLQIDFNAFKVRKVKIIIINVGLIPALTGDTLTHKTK